MKRKYSFWQKLRNVPVLNELRRRNAELVVELSRERARKDGDVIASYSNLEEELYRANFRIEESINENEKLRGLVKHVKAELSKERRAFRKIVRDFSKGIEHLLADRVELAVSGMRADIVICSSGCIREVSENLAGALGYKFNDKKVLCGVNIDKVVSGGLEEMRRCSENERDSYCNLSGFDGKEVKLKLMYFRENYLDKSKFRFVVKKDEGIFYVAKFEINSLAKKIAGVYRGFREAVSGGGVDSRGLPDLLKEGGSSSL